MRREIYIQYSFYYMFLIYHLHPLLQPWYELKWCCCVYIIRKMKYTYNNYSITYFIYPLHPLLQPWYILKCCYVYRSLLVLSFIYIFFVCSSRKALSDSVKNNVTLWVRWSIPKEEIENNRESNIFLDKLKHKWKKYI